MRRRVAPVRGRHCAVRRGGSAVRGRPLASATTEAPACPPMPTGVTPASAPGIGQPIADGGRAPPSDRPLVRPESELGPPVRTRAAPHPETSTSTQEGRPSLHARFRTTRMSTLTESGSRPANSKGSGLSPVRPLMPPEALPTTVVLRNGLRSRSDMAPAANRYVVRRSRWGTRPGRRFCRSPR